MNQAEVSDSLCVGFHDSNGGEEAYATEYPKMNQDSVHEATKFDVVMETPVMYSDHSNGHACLDGYQYTGMMAEIQPLEEVGFGNNQHFKGVRADSEDENLSSSPATSSTTNHDTHGYMDQFQNICNSFNEIEMVDQEGPVMLSPEFVICNTTVHNHPHLTFSSEGFKIEYHDQDSCEDDEMIALYWDISDIIGIHCKWTQSVESAFMTLLIGTSADPRNSGSVRVELCLTDPQWTRKQQAICQLASRYQEIWNNIPSDDFALENQRIDPSLFFSKQYFSWNNNFEDIIYPKGDPDAVSVSSRDVELLLPEAFVNDTIIDFYIKYLRTRIETTEKSRYHFFNSFFFRKLADLDKDQGRAPEGRSAFLRVRKWTRKIDVFSKDFLFIPVNFNLHWSLIVICYPGEVDTFKDGETKLSGKVPCILHMDSLKGSHSGLKDIIQSYLWEEWKERHPESASNSSDKFLNLRFVSLELPQQDNSFDCGLFLLHYVELFLMDAPSSFNPLNIDVSSSFLSDDWFVPAEASLKRSLIRKLIHEVVTEPSKNYPKLACRNEQLGESHGRSENSEQEPVKEVLSEGCSAGELNLVCTLPGTQQQSTSICVNDSEKSIPASGCILETGRVLLLHLQELQVCPPHGVSVDLPSQDVKDEPHLADCDNQLNLISHASESGEGDDDCAFKDKDTHEKALLDSLDIDQENSSHGEVKMHHMMDSKCCSISDNSQEIMACQEHALERNINTDDDCIGASKDKDSVTMFDANKHGNGLDAESTKSKADGRRCDLSEDTNAVMIGDINKEVSDSSLERNIVEDEYNRRDISEGGSVMTDVINKDVADCSFERNVIEYEDTKHEDTQVNPILVEDAIEDNTKECSITVYNINGNDQYISSTLKMGNTDDDVTSCHIVSCDLKEVNIDNVMAGDRANETNADGEDAQDELVTGEAAPREDDITCNDAEMPHVDSSSSAKIETVFENTVCDKRPHPDNTSETNADGKDAHDDLVTGEAAPCQDDTTCNEAEMPHVDSSSSPKTETVSENTVCDKRPHPDSTSETNTDGEDAQDDLVADEAAPCEDNTTCNEAEMLHVDSSSSAKIETDPENTVCDVKRPHPDSTPEDKHTLDSDDKCLQEYIQCSEEKSERYYKRRKITTVEVLKRCTRSSSMAPSLD